MTALGNEAGMNMTISTPASPARWTKTPDGHHAMRDVEVDARQFFLQLDYIGPDDIWLWQVSEFQDDGCILLNEGQGYSFEQASELAAMAVLVNASSLGITRRPSHLQVDAYGTLLIN